MDKLIIDTPEQVHLEFLLAGIGSRFMAALLDSLIQAAIVFVVFLIGMIFFSGLAPIWGFAILMFLSFSITWGYYASFEALWKGQTPGKRWAGIRVIKESGRPINAFEAISRNFVRIIDYMPGFYGVGVVTMLLNSKQRRLGDFVAGTLVVHESSDRDATPFFNTEPGSEFVFPQAVRLTLQEAELIEAFLARRLDITSAVRQQTAERIAQMVSNRLGIAHDARPADTEAFLELIVREFRSRARYR
ncbi:MAG TPA: RDD family protein [Candidatus Angelobacter sp.]|nr:RDD family protein [Candidatus Angelobacter sp.]